MSVICRGSSLFPAWALSPPISLFAPVAHAAPRSSPASFPFSVSPSPSSSCSPPVSSSNASSGGTSIFATSPPIFCHLPLPLCSFRPSPFYWARYRRNFFFPVEQHPRQKPSADHVGPAFRSRPLSFSFLCSGASLDAFFSFSLSFSLFSSLFYISFLFSLRTCLCVEPAL